MWAWEVRPSRRSQRQRKWIRKQKSPETICFTEWNQRLRVPVGVSVHQGTFYFPQASNQNYFWAEQKINKGALAQIESNSKNHKSSIRVEELRIWSVANKPKFWCRVFNISGLETTNLSGESQVYWDMPTKFQMENESSNGLMDDASIIWVST